ncbi:MAG TPA: DUF1905 domain-containing protein [Ilumatobacteraceae bacterium]|nr:DUF1905 domain-containing protein [Ilumatobacteraceae bacterium]
MTTFEFTADLWRYSGKAAWYFVTLPHDVADDIDEITGDERRGFGSVRVEVTVGATTWNTSVFPDTKSESFVLPVKKAVRTAEDLDDGSPVAVVLALIDL